ncbi:alpha/beta hydrolase-fold protein [Streptomyces sp. BPTC-684]|uniref:alpha/beta hydrolase-fold protein n=1 Tax=Streptomyces sp. BPTC-684 TaxID=3043734 RepID=UPI0024B09C57|nr:alpha/beta hydrolase-fold protein [Streptomyces sp. BPTC-684]WHM37603.1 alpha/beta hydrolase-fold protein [Streptomyces sp. BPTC-684]
MPEPLGTRVLVEHTSARLRDNPLGDPAARRIEVLLPPGYDESARHPVVYWLPGFGVHPTLTTRALAFGEAPADRIHRAMARGDIPAALIVVPDATTAYGGSQYIDSPACGRYLGYLGEVVAEVDRRFPTLAEPRWRAVGGKSSGGYGAVVAAMRTDLFGAVLAHTPDAGFEHSYLPLLPGVLDTLEAAGGVERLLEKRESGPHDTPFMVAMSLLAMGMCYADKPGTTPADALPCDPRTGVFRPEVWERWLRHDPVRMASAHADRLKALRLLYLDTGLRDDYHMHWGARALHAVWRERGIAHEYQEHDGGHHGIEHRFLTSLALLGRVWRAGGRGD